MGGTFYGKETRPDEMPTVTQGGAEMPSGETKEAQATPQRVIEKKDIQKATEALAKYKQGKANLEKRVVEDELWWKRRHWEIIRKQGANDGVQPTSAWLFNSIINKHADAMDNVPEPVVLPREPSDKGSAQILNEVLPVIMKANDFEKTFSEVWWDKLKHGTGVFGVFWNSDKESGLGDIDIHKIDLLKIFWEPGVTDIQKSRNLFIVELCDKDLLEEQYPELKGKLNGTSIDVAQYKYDDTVDVSDKAVVVDWYYKVQYGSKTLVHYVKYVGDEVLYASENDPNYRDRGFYDHGLYPVFFDTMFPEEGTPVGFGFVSVNKDAQMYIDKLSGNILETSVMNAKRRYFVSKNTNINLDQFKDSTQSIIEVEGSLDDLHIKEFTPRAVDGASINMLQFKIEEMKETSANRDVNSGGAGGATAAAAIAALQESGNKVSRDAINSAYRVYTEVCKCAIELIRQFYTEVRAFRITAPDGAGGYEFVEFSNEQMGGMPTGIDGEGNPLFRVPIYDLDIRAQKKSPFSIAVQNETAKELYAAGFFNPERAQEALGAIEMMEFEGKEDVKKHILEGQTLFNMVQQLQMQVQQMQMMLMGQAAPAPDIPTGRGAPSEMRPDKSVSGDVMTPNVPRTSYAENLAKRSKPSIA